MKSQFDPDKHRRRSIRLPGYDYTRPAAYFVTVCTRNRECLFGDVVDGEMRLNELGETVRACWHEIPDHFPHVGLDEFVIMPNHVHGILVIVETNVVGARHVGARHAVPLRQTQRTEQFGKPLAGSIPTIIRSFKSAVTKRINDLRGTAGITVWQRNYYEHVIRDEESLNRIRQYIIENPRRWHLDRENPDRMVEDTLLHERRQGEQ